MGTAEVVWVLQRYVTGYGYCRGMSLAMGTACSTIIELKTNGMCQKRVVTSQNGAFEKFF